MFTATEAYDRHVGRYSNQLGRKLIAAAGVQAGPEGLGHRLRARRADERAGRRPGLAERRGGGAVRAVRASVRAARPAPTWRIAAAEDLPFADAAFDVTLSQLVVNFMRDAHQGLSEMVRVTRPGGDGGGGGWDYGGEMTLLRALLGHRDGARPGRDRQGRGAGHAVRDAAGARGAVVERACRTSRSPMRWASADYEGFEDLWAPFAKGVGPAGCVRADAGRPGAPFKAEFRRRLDVGDEPFTLTARAWIATGTTR